MVGEWTGIPVSRLLESERQRLAHLEDLLGRGGRLFFTHDPEAALAVCEQVLAREPDLFEAHFLRAMILRDRGERIHQLARAEAERVGRRQGHLRLQFRQVGLGLGDGVLPEVEDTGRQHGVRAADALERFGEALFERENDKRAAGKDKLAEKIFEIEREVLVRAQRP